MKRFNVWFAMATVWFSVALAVCFGIYYTHSAKCLFAFILPSCMSFESNSTDDNEGKEDDKQIQ